MPHIDWTIRLSDVITWGVGLVLVVTAWRDISWRLTNLEEWKQLHFHTTEEAVRNITMLREAVVKIEYLARGQDRRLELLEGNAQWASAKRQ